MVRRVGLGGRLVGGVGDFTSAHYMLTSPLDKHFQ